MKIKVLSLILSLAFIGNACMAQYSFFKPLKKPVHPQSFTRAMSMGISPSLLKDSTINAFRPIVVAAAYAEPGNTLMAGAGFSFQSLTFDPNTQAWYCNYSISAVGFAGGSVVPNTPTSIISVGLLAGLLNNKILLGPIYNPGTKQFGAAIAIGLNLNNN